MLKSSTLQVLSMSRLGGAGAVAPLVTDIPLSSVEVINESILYLLGFLFISISLNNHASVLLTGRRWRRW